MAKSYSIRSLLYLVAVTALLFAVFSFKVENERLRAVCEAYGLTTSSLAYRVFPISRDTILIRMPAFQQFGLEGCYYDHHNDELTCGKIFFSEPQLALTIDNSAQNAHMFLVSTMKPSHGTYDIGSFYIPSFTQFAWNLTSDYEGYLDCDTPILALFFHSNEKCPLSSDEVLTKRSVGEMQDFCREKQVSFFVLQPTPRTDEIEDSVLQSYSAGPLNEPLHIHYLGNCVKEHNGE